MGQDQKKGLLVSRNFLEVELPRRSVLAGGLAASVMPGLAALSPTRAEAANLQKLDTDASAALARLYARSEKARELAARSRAVLIFPRIAKAGFIVGGQGGDGVLRIHHHSVGYYQIAALSFGFQAGVQAFSYALFFVTQSALDYLDHSKGWAIGTGPSVVIADAGFAKNFNTTNLTQDVYAVPFGQKGLMAGISLEGSKISRISG